jgi:hypothetical protein
MSSLESRGQETRINVLGRNGHSPRWTYRSGESCAARGPPSMRVAARALATAPTGELQSAMPRLRQRAPAALPAVLENILRACVLPPVGACTATDWAASLAWCSRVSAAGKLVRPRGELAHILSLPPLYLGKIANLVLVCTVRAWALLAQLDVQTSHLISVFLPFLCD